ncbi:MAG: hypothetical protein WBB73_12205, partial [Candidatus Aminicenantaceae bacterium]
MKIRIRHILAWAGISIAVLTALLLVGRGILNYTNGKKLERELERRKAEGIPLVMGDIEPECSSRENAAVEWKAAEAILSVSPEMRPIINNIVYEIAERHPLDEEKRAALVSTIEQNREALRLVLAAAEKPCFKYEEEWNKPGYDIMIPNAVKMIRATRLLGVDAMFKSEEGDIELAVRQCLSAIQFSRVTLDNPLLISYLVSLANAKQVAVCLREIVSTNEVETPVLETILKQMDASPWQEGLKGAFASERIFGLEIILLHLQGENPLGLNAFEKAFSWLLRPVMKTEAIQLMKWYDRQIEAAGMPHFKRRPLMQEFQESLDSLPWYYMISEYVFPNFLSVYLKLTTLEAMIDTARIGLACRIYK